MKKFLILMMTVCMMTFLLAGCTPKSEDTAPAVNEDASAEASEEAPATEEVGSEPVELVVSTWGYNEDLLRKNVFEPFEKEFNAKIVLETGNNSDRLNKIRVMENSSVDVIFLAESFSMEAAEEGLFEKIDRNNIPNLANIYDIAQSPNGADYGPAYTLNRTGIIYDSAMVDHEVTSWSDLWRPEFENNMSIPEITTTAGPPVVIVAGNLVGVNPFDNSDDAFAKLVALKPNLVKTYSRSSELVNMFTQGEIIIGVAQDFAFGSIKEAVPTAEWVNPEEGAFVNFNTINIVKGSDNKELAEDLINFWLSDEVQLANALDKIDSPVSVNVDLDEEQAAGLTYGQELISALKPIDWSGVNAAKAEWIDKWNREVSN